MPNERGRKNRRKTEIYAIFIHLPCASSESKAFACTHRWIWTFHWTTCGTRLARYCAHSLSLSLLLGARCVFPCDRQNSNVIGIRTERDMKAERCRLEVLGTRIQFPLCSTGAHQRRNTSVVLQFSHFVAALAYRFRRAFRSSDSTTSSSGTKHYIDAKAPNGVSRNTKHCGKRRKPEWPTEKWGETNRWQWLVTVQTIET